MRIVIDLQGCQTGSRFRGIGRYSMAFTKAVLRNCKEHEVFVVLNGLLNETIQNIRDELADLLSIENILVWHSPGPVSDKEGENDSRREYAEYIRESFIASLKPDVVHITSLFEGFGDNAVVSIGRFAKSFPVSVSFYDLIPYRNSEYYLKSNLLYELHYLRKIESLARADLLLSISEYAKTEALEYLKIQNTKVVNISSAVDNIFSPGEENANVLSRLRVRTGLHKPFILYSGGADIRKNIFKLIEAYSLLPSDVRSRYQLLLAGHMPEGNIFSLRKYAESLYLESSELLFADYVTDEELVNLYYACELYVFPSWDEGFGLPALEAMACGTPVIGANTTSVPEVIQWEEALFNPFNVHEITQKMLHALVDETFRFQLIENGLRRATHFSWDETGRRAIEAWENLASCTAVKGKLNVSYGYSHFLEAAQHLRDIPDERNWNELANCLVLNRGASIERQLFVDVSELCNRDSATGVQRVVKSYLNGLLSSPPAGFRVEPVYASGDTGYKYARKFTKRFLRQNDETVDDELVLYCRGDIFFVLDLQHHVQLAHREFFSKIREYGVTVKFLVYDLLPIQLVDQFYNSELKSLHEKLLTMIATMDGAICISRATEEALLAWISQNGIETAANFKTSVVHIGGDIEASHPSIGMQEVDVQIVDKLRNGITFLCVATLEPRKGQQQVIEAFEILWNRGVNLNLVLVGKKGWKVELLVDRIRDHPEFGHRLFWLDGISDEYLNQIYEVSNCLIAASINEGFGLPLIEAARWGKPVIARDIAVFREVAGEHAHYFNGHEPGDLAESVMEWLANCQLEGSVERTNMHWLTWTESTEKLKQELVERNYRRRQIFVDISELIQRDAKTGIQRVVRNILGEWLRDQPEGYRIEPVYATVGQSYRYARAFNHLLTGSDKLICPDELIEYMPGDIFIGLDFQPQVVISQREYYKLLRSQGVLVYFLMYDMLSILMPNNFTFGAELDFTRWLNVVVESDGIACISKTVASDFARWIEVKGIKLQDRFRVQSFALGSNIILKRKCSNITRNISDTLYNIEMRRTFLVVGTLEPRKSHEQILFAFDQLWTTGHNVNLVFIGKQGWKVDALISYIQLHPELNKRFFWLNSADDEFMEKIYSSCTCLIAASKGEGFGLPLIEAASYGMPIIARDLPIFHEVCNDSAYYFSGDLALDLSNAISIWLGLFDEGTHPNSIGIKYTSWEDSANQLMEFLIRKSSKGVKILGRSIRDIQV